jgi:hypothetical protein
MRLLAIIGLALGLVCVNRSDAQTDTVKPARIAVFAPVYLDSAFTGDTYKLGRNNLPKYILPGLDFYNGMLMAVDSLNAENAPVEVLFYDSKNPQSSIQALSTDPDFHDISLIIASFNNRAEVKPLAELAMQQQILLISATYPNDGGTSANPYFIMLNSNLNTHIEAIFRYFQRMYPLENILVFRRKSNAADFIQNSFAELNRKTAGTPLKLLTIELPDNFTPDQVTGYLDSTKQNIVFCGSLDENFGLNLSKALSSAKIYPVTVVGMPTWDGIKDIGKGIDITYSTPYNLTRTDKLSHWLTTKYRELYAGRPSDMFFKGFESMYHFSKLLLKHRDSLMYNLSDKSYKLFADFDIRPVQPKEGTTPDYLENKKIYFIRKIDGKLKSVS